MSEVGHTEQNQESITISQYKGSESLRLLRRIAFITSGILIFLTLVQIVLSYIYAYKYPLRHAILWVDIEAVEKLMAKGYDPNHKIGSRTPLTYTILNCLHTPAAYIRHEDEEDYKKR